MNSEKRSYCNSCHFPDSFAIEDMDVGWKIKPKPGMPTQGGLTCAGCHLTPEGIIRGARNIDAPHITIADPAFQTSAVCAQCHNYNGAAKRAVGREMRTFLEWREDFSGPGLGKQQCQDCHMQRTLRKVAEDYDGAPRPVARHTFTGANSRQRHLDSLSLTIIQPVDGKRELVFQVSNIGAGHSVPTGPSGRAVFLQVDALDKEGISRARKEWMFAPSCSDRPDDKAFLEEDKKLPDGAAQARADAQGPHESSIRAGEDRRLAWEPDLASGEYMVKSKLVYTLDRYNDKPTSCSQPEIGATALAITIK